MLRFARIALIGALFAVTLIAGACAAEQPSQEWSFSTGAYVTASPVYQNNVLYVGSHNGKLYAISTLYGYPSWNATTSNQTPSPIQASPLVVTDEVTRLRTVYFGSDQGTMFSVDGSSGKEQWRFNAGSSIDCTPTLYNGILYFGTFDGKVHAVKADDGASVWNFTADGWISNGIEAKDNMIYFGSSDGNLYALETGYGKQKQKTKLDGRVSAPTIDGDYLYVGTQNGTLYCISRYSGNVQWQYYTGGTIASKPLVQLNTVYFGSADGYVYALNETSGKLLWKYQTGEGVKATPGFDSGILYIGSGDGKVYAVDARMGLEYWQYSVGEAVDTTPVASEYLKKKYLYFATVNGNIISLKLPTALVMATPTPTPRPTATSTPAPTVTITPTPVPLPSVTPEPQSSWCPLPGLFAAALAVVGIAYRRLK